MAIEFNLLYRWHGLIPPAAHRRASPCGSTIFNPAMVVERGLAALLDDASHKRAGRVGLFNTDPALRVVELAEIREARAVQLAPYNDYRELAVPARHRLRPDHGRRARPGGAARPLRRTSTGSSSSRAVRRGRAAELRPAVADRPDGRRRRVLAGADQPAAGAAGVQRADVLAAGMEIIAGTSRLSDIVHRNVPESPGEYLVTMTRADWKRV